MSIKTDIASTDYQKILNPGAIIINVEGAFIVDDDNEITDTSTTPLSTDTDQTCDSISTRSRSPESGRLSPSDRDYLKIVKTSNGAEKSRDIALPFQNTNVDHLALDIGGSLAKIVYFTKDPNGKGGRLNFIKFETEKIDDFINYLKSLIPAADISSSHKNHKTQVMATGGGSFKFYEKLIQELSIEITREDEMECLIVGLDFFITEIPNEVFLYAEYLPNNFTQYPEPNVDSHIKNKDEIQSYMQFVDAKPNIYPYLLVNIGSGVSMIQVTGPKDFVRIGGSSLGGGTLWGLLSLLTDAKSYDEMLDMAAKGDNSQVDMLVSDVYGTDYNKIGLKASTIASSFGKVFKRATKNETDMGDMTSSKNPSDKEKRLNKFSGEDISISLLYAISNNIGQIAYLQAQRHGLEDIYFGGSYIRGHPQTMNTLSYAINFWSQGEKKAYFLRHEGFLGAVGAFLKHQPTGWGRRNSGSFDDNASLREQFKEFLRSGNTRTGSVTPHGDVDNYPSTFSSPIDYK